MFRHAVANVICSVVFGSRYSYSDAAFLELLNAIGNYISFFLSPVAKVRAQRLCPLPSGAEDAPCLWEGPGGSGQEAEPRRALPRQVYNTFPGIVHRLPGPHRRVLADCQKLKEHIREKVQLHQLTLDSSCPRDYIDCFLMRAEKVEGGCPPPAAACSTPRPP